MTNRLKPAETYTHTHTHTHTHTCNPLKAIKQIGTICFAIFSILISAPLFATGVSSGATSADCDNATLDTYTGTSNLQVDWQPNTIALHWYNGDTEITSGVQTSCVYDGTLTPPTTIPTKTGYTFKGWRVKQADTSCFASQVCSLTGSAVNGLTGEAGYFGLISNDGQDIDNANTYNLTSNGTWALEFTNGGIIRGIASCNSTNSTMWDTVLAAVMNETMTNEQAYNALWGSCSSDTIKPSNTSFSSPGQYCWCKMTSYTPSGSNACNVASPSWVFGGDAGDSTNCGHECTRQCLSNGMIVAEFRRAMFGVSQ